MLGYIVHRILIMIPTLIAISIVIFTIIHLPPGDYFSTYIAELQSSGRGRPTSPRSLSSRRNTASTSRYGSNTSIWVGGLLHGDMGYSFALRPAGQPRWSATGCC